jgi:hypothetical protein
MTQPPPELLTTAELEALDLTSRLTAKLNIIFNGITSADYHEAIHAIHVLQNMVMSQAAARAYPERFRLLGEVGRG